MQHASSSIKNKRILLAEDCDDSRDILTFLFSKSGAEVEAVSNGSECVDRVLQAKNESRPFDIVLMDVHMPVLDGNEATKKLRAQGFTKPIVAITGQSTEEEKKHCIASGCNAFVSKLTSKDKMIDAIEAVLSEDSEARRSNYEIPALPFVPHILRTNPEYAPKILKFIENIDQKVTELETLLAVPDERGLFELCGALSNASFYGYQIFADRLAEFQKFLEHRQYEEARHALRLLSQAAKSIKLGYGQVQKYIA